MRYNQPINAGRDMTTRAKFQGVADKLFTKFADVLKMAAFSVPGAGGTLDPITGVITGGSAPVDSMALVLREEYTAREVDGQKIQVNDFKLLVRVQELTLDPRTDSATVTVLNDGTCNIITANKDAADAVWTLQVRKI